MADAGTSQWLRLMTIACRCIQCSVLLEHPLEEFYLDLEGAVEQAKKNKSQRIPLMCPKCTAEYLHGQLRIA